MSYHDSPSSSSHHPHQTVPDRQHHSPPRSGAATPTSASASSPSFSSSFYNAFGSLMRRLSSDPAGHLQPADPADGSRSLDPSSTAPPEYTYHGQHNHHHHHQHQPQHHTFPTSSRTHHQNNGAGAGFAPSPFPRTASPMQPPPLEPLILTGFNEDTPASARLLSAAIAEEIRIMVPERLRIEDEWKLVYSLDQDGASLATLYEKCAAYTEHRNGFVLVVQDQEGGVFGAYLSEYPHRSPHYFGTGECFLWRASLLASLPPPPSADTTQMAGRSITIPGASSLSHPSSSAADQNSDLLIPGLPAPPGAGATATSSTAASLASTPSLVSLSSVTSSASSTVLPPPPRPQSSPSIRFNAYPYSGVNEYFMYCENHSLSIGGGDGKYGLWLDDSLERGVSSTCLTFGNQPLSDEGDKFGVLGVEVWVIGSRG